MSEPPSCCGTPEPWSRPITWRIGEAFADQGFSLVDRTSFAVMERLGLGKVVTFDDDFAIYRYGPRRQRAFEVQR